MCKNKIIYKTRIGITPYINWFLIIGIIIFFIFNIKSNPTVISVLIILAIIFLCSIYSDEIIIRENCFDINKNRFFNIKKMQKNIFFYKDIQNISLIKSKVELSYSIIPTPRRKGNRFIIILKDGTHKEFNIKRLTWKNLNHIVNIINIKKEL